MDRWRNHVAVVTGASSGMGAVIAKDLVNAGLKVVALARRKERLEEIRAKLPNNLRTRFYPLRCDVSDLNSVKEAFNWIAENLKSVDILINNAGINVTGQLLTLDPIKLHNVLQTNVMGVIYCTQSAFKIMKDNNIDGHVVLINSVAGHYVFNPPPGVLPEFNIYPPSKYAVTAINEVLRQEFRDLGTKIKVTSISPGFVSTDIVPEGYKNLPMLQPEDVSSAVLYAISTPPHVQIHELTIKPVGENI